MVKLIVCKLHLYLKWKNLKSTKHSSFKMKKLLKIKTICIIYTKHHKEKSSATLHNKTNYY